MAKVRKKVAGKRKIAPPKASLFEFARVAFGSRCMGTPIKFSTKRMARGFLFEHEGKEHVLIFSGRGGKEPEGGGIFVVYVPKAWRKILWLNRCKKVGAVETINGSRQKRYLVLQAEAASCDVKGQMSDGYQCLLHLYSGEMEVMSGQWALR